MICLNKPSAWSSNLKFVVGAAKDYKQYFNDAQDLAEQTNQRFTVFKYYSRSLARVVFCFDNDKLIGFYLYTSGKVFFAQRSNILISIQLIDHTNVDLNRTSIAIISALNSNYSEDVHLEMMRLRHIDAGQQGYLYSIAGINSDYEDDAVCKMAKWTQDIVTISKLTNTAYEVLPVMNDHGDPLILHHHPQCE